MTQAPFRTLSLAAALLLTAGWASAYPSTPAAPPGCGEDKRPPDQGNPPKTSTDPSCGGDHPENPPKNPPKS